MGYDYALVHIRYTIPPTLLLASLYYPLATRIGLYKILFLVFVAVTATIPWDSYLIRTHIWTYPADVIIGPTLFDIPLEEVFFFVIQTVFTSLMYLIISKPTFHSIYLKSGQALRRDYFTRGGQWFGTALLLLLVGTGFTLLLLGQRGLYLGLILSWAGPFALMLWILAHQFIINLPLSNTVLPIIVPTLYLWIVDTLALRRGTWSISSGTKIGLHIWPHLELEEAIFFLLTNIMIVFGLVAFDNAHAIIQTFPHLFPHSPAMPSPKLLVQALITPLSAYDESRVIGLADALNRLRAKSRSFYLASGIFDGRLRIDLIILYSFCRVADDLIDEATEIDEACDFILKLRGFLDICYRSPKHGLDDRIRHFVTNNFPPHTHHALLLLPTARLAQKPLYDLLKGFEMDLAFSKSSKQFPIADEAALSLYGARVAGTVAELCIQLAYHHSALKISKTEQRKTLMAGARMGIALQYINIARDVTVDALNGRVYLPTSWLVDENMTSQGVLKEASGPRIEHVRQRLLSRAMEIYHESKAAIEDLPVESQVPMRVAVESYVEIGRILQTPGYKVKAGRATVPKLRRLRVAWKALQTR